jgi:hypothetical protein
MGLGAAIRSFYPKHMKDEGHEFTMRRAINREILHSRNSRTSEKVVA